MLHLLCSQGLAVVNYSGTIGAAQLQHFECVNNTG